MKYPEIQSEVVGPKRRVYIICETAETVPGLLTDNTAKVAFSILQDLVRMIRRNDEDGEDTYGLQRYGSGVSHVLQDAYPETTAQWWIDQAKATVDHEEFELIWLMGNVR